MNNNKNSLFSVKIVPIPSDDFVKSQSKFKEFITTKKINGKNIGKYPRAKY